MRMSKRSNFREGAMSVRNNTECGQDRFSPHSYYAIIELAETVIELVEMVIELAKLCSPKVNDHIELNSMTLPGASLIDIVLVSPPSRQLQVLQYRRLYL